MGGACCQVLYCKTAETSDVWRLLAFAYRQKFGDAPLPSIAKEPSGKPFFAGDEDAYFSVSHTKGAVMVALADCKCGCDIELAKPRNEKLASRIATTEELESFSFYELWVLKECAVKIGGEVPEGEVYDYMLASIFSRTASGVVLLNDDSVCKLFDLGPWCAATLVEQGSISEPTHVDLGLLPVHGCMLA